ncbi:MAG: DNA-processing protein DprA [Kiritimatiellae bacterium]|nr:DNA-processing protein DprA [Kiritimatiellia bacterium]
MNEREAYIALNMMAKIGPVGVRSLISVCGSAVAIFEASASDMMQAEGIGRELSASITRQRDEVDWNGEIERAESMQVNLVTFIDEEYPAALKEIHDPPLALYIKGTLESRDARGIAIVGTRRPTHYGRDVGENLAFHLGRAGFTVVSGLATGIDTVAHRGALKAKARTLAVLGGALNCFYPAANRELGREISERGAVISEFPFGKKPDKTTFPMRNRIVSGLSMGIIVVEAGAKSGSLITAHQAMDQGRTVFAVPGRIDSAVASGPHKLIRDGAVLVEGVDTVLEEFDCLLPSSAMKARLVPKVEFTAEEQVLIKLLVDGELGVDTLIRNSGLPAAKTNSLLMGLEMKKQVRMLPGRIVEKIGKL